jgi:phosphatidylethanolamine-binding protein (PEBP) family uncharacterized protein
MRGTLAGLTATTLLLLLAITGCGGSSSKSTSSAAQGTGASQTATKSSAATSTSTTPTTSTTHSTSASSATPRAALTLSSAAFQAGRPIANGEHAIADLYTCDGSGISPPVRWSGVPAGTAELFLLVLDLRGPGGSKRFFNWAVAGLKPTLRGIPAGRLPNGAVVARNGLGRSRYSLCPAKGRLHPYIVILYALPYRLAVRPGFDPNAVYEKIGGANLPEAQSGFAYRRR